MFGTISGWFCARCLPELAVKRRGTSVVACSALFCAGGAGLKVGSGTLWCSGVGLRLNFWSSSSSLFTSLSHMVFADSAGLESILTVFCFPTKDLKI